MAASPDGRVARIFLPRVVSIFSSARLPASPVPPHRSPLRRCLRPLHNRRCRSRSGYRRACGVGPQQGENRGPAARRGHRRWGLSCPSLPPPRPRQMMDASGRVDRRGEAKEKAAGPPRSDGGPAAKRWRSGGDDTQATFLPDATAASVQHPATLRPHGAARTANAQAAHLVTISLPMFRVPLPSRFWYRVSVGAVALSFMAL